MQLLDSIMPMLLSLGFTEYESRVYYNGLGKLYS